MKRVILFILIIFMMVLIFKFSSSNGEDSTKQSMGLIGKTIGVIAEIINPDITEEEKLVLYEKYHVPVRKLAHISEYFILCLLVCMFLCTYNISYKKIIVYSFIFCFLYACSDEVHQLYVPGRSGNIKDVFIDSIGISFVLVVYYFKKRGKV
jgi:VanZ family protein